MNQIQRFKGFVYESVRFIGRDAAPCIEIDLRAHNGCRGKCVQCRRPAPGYDRLPLRRWRFVPLWGIDAWFCYAPRRVNCPDHGIGVEYVPWSDGKRPLTAAMMSFLSRWARRLSWRETAEVFHVSWEAVYRSVDWVVQWGLAHRQLDEVTAIGLDEIHWGKGKGADNFLTVIYQIDRHCRRLLWVGPRRTQATLRRGLAALGPQVVQDLKFVCSDMWQPYRQVLAEKVGHALHILDRFHISMHLNRAVDETRRAECARLRDNGSGSAAKLKNMRWKLLRRGSKVRGRARQQLNGLFRAKLATARAWMLKETFRDFWRYRSVYWAAAFLQVWTERALRSRIEPMRKVARMLRAHEPLIMNWFRAKGEISNAIVEGLNNKIRVITRRSYGFRTYHAMQTALYHNLAQLPEPELTHSFC